MTLRNAILMVFCAGLAAPAAAGPGTKERAPELSRLTALSRSLDAFRADFQVRETRFALPKSYVKAAVEYELNSIETQAPATNTPEGKLILEAQKQAAVKVWDERAAGLETRGSGTLYVKGARIRWDGPRVALAYSGKDFFYHTNPQGVRTVDNTVTYPGLHIQPGLSAVSAQALPYYGALHPATPMFSVQQAQAARPAPGGWWRVGPIMRYGSPGAGMLRFDARGRVAEYRIFLDGEGPTPKALAERWQFRGWKKQGKAEFPTQIQADYYRPTPPNVEEFSTVPERKLVLTLTAFSQKPVPNQVFDLQHPASGTQVQDDRYNPPVFYAFRRNRTNSPLDQISAYYDKHRDDPTLIGSNPGRQRAWTAIGLLAALMALLALRRFRDRRPKPADA